MKRLILSAVALGIFASAAPSIAQQAWQSINERQADYFSRIEGGVKNGSLTPAEATSLKARFTAIAAKEEEYRRSGGLDARERRDLDDRLDQLKLSIVKQKHDAQARR